MVEEDFQASKGLAALDVHQVRCWGSWYRWATFAILALALRSPPPVVRLAGRQVALEDAGPESGFPVLVHHGGTRQLFPGAVQTLRLAAS
jgi:hypothetical protein